MSAYDPPAPEPSPFDRLGSFLGDLAAVTSSISARNAELWMSSASSAASGGSYRPERELARWTAIATANAQDVAALFLGLTPRQVVAYPIATAFLHFKSRVDERGDLSWMLADQVVIPLACGAVERLPDHASIHLSGADPAGVAALERSLRTRLGEYRMSYLLESYDVRDLRPGSYQGMVYLDGEVRRPLANLLVVVDGPPADVVPWIVLRWEAQRGHEPRWHPHLPITVPAPPHPSGFPPAAHAVLAGGEPARRLARKLSVGSNPTGSAYLLRADPPPDDLRDTFFGSIVTDSGAQRTTIARLEVHVDGLERERDADE